MPRKVETLPVRDFTGGINYMADAFQLAEGELTDALNVDFDPNGGFRRRDPVQIINTSSIPSTRPAAMWSFVTSSAGTAQIVVQTGDDFAYSTGGNFTAVNPDALTTTGTMNAASANDLLYIQRGASQAAIKWTGAAATVLTDSHGAYNDNLASPAGGKMPKAKYICHHLNYLFHANINEGGTQQYNRVRFSHPFSDGTGKGAEDYRTNDWIPVGQGDGDAITGMASWQRELIIFKNQSVWRLRGYGPDSFTLDCISKTTGAVSQQAIVVGDEGVYFFSWPNGLQLWDGSQVRDLWYPMTPLTEPLGNGTTIDQLAVDPTQAANTTVGYVNQRVWVSLTSSGESLNDMTFVYDPRLGKRGGWTRYDLGLGPFVTHAVPGANRTWYAVTTESIATNHVLQLHDGSHGLSDQVTVNAGLRVDRPITSWAFTKWYDLGNPALIKRWKHPIFVCDAADSVVLHTEVFRDYDLQSPHRSFDLTIDAIGSGYTWGGGTWGGGTWSAATNGNAQSIEKGGLLGRGTAIAVRVYGPPNGDTPWAVNAITFKYIPRRIRS